MKIKRALTLTLLLSSSLLPACSKSGLGLPKGEICAKQYDPLPLDVSKTADKVTLSPMGLPPGDYEHSSTEIYYHDSSTGVKIHVTDGREKSTGGYVRPVCVAGLSPDQDFSFSAASIGKLQIAEGGKALVSPRVVTVSFRNSTLERSFDDQDGAELDRPEKVFEGGQTEHGFFKTRGNDNSEYQLRSKSTQGTETIYLVIKLKRKTP